MKTLLTRWPFGRTLRLFLGLVILVQGIIVRDATSIVLGLILGGMSFLNIGCCGGGQCKIDNKPVTKRDHNLHSPMDE